MQYKKALKLKRFHIATILKQTKYQTNDRYTIKKNKIVQQQRTNICILKS